MFLLSASIKARKLLPYQDYLLYKPTGSVRTKAYFQQTSDTSDSGIVMGRSDELSKASCNEESDLNFDTSCVPAISTEASVVFDNSTECDTISTLQTYAPDTLQQVSDLSSELPTNAGNTHLPPSSFPSANSANKVSDMSTATHADYERMSAANRKRVSEFFSHSRLHYIAMWGAECKAYVTRLQSQVS